MHSYLARIFVDIPVESCRLGLCTDTNIHLPVLTFLNTTPTKNSPDRFTEQLQRN